jgi:hypothetical protein
MLGQAAMGLLLDPGLGKTSIALSAFKILQSLGHVSKMLVVAPLRPAYLTWPAEMEKWANFNGLTYQVLHGSKKLDKLAEDVDIYIINPEGLFWLFGQPEWEELGCDCLCVDESTKFKNSTTKRFKSLKAQLFKFKRRWILTGTFQPNTVLDLFGQIFILDGGHKLGRFITHYRNKYFYQPNPWEKFTWALRPEAFEEITESIAPLTLVLKAEDHLEMPELIKQYIPVKLPPSAMQMYKDVEDDFITMLGNQALVANNAAAAGTKCRQIANGAVYDAEGEWHPVHDEKLTALKDLLEQLGGQPVLLLYEYHHDYERICEALGHQVPVIGSKTSAKKAEAYLHLFNAGELPILAGHPASMGHGLNLQGACKHVIWFGVPWNFEFYDQAIRRVYRQGQKSGEVYVYHIVAEDTLDERVIQVLDQKEGRQEALLKSMALLRESP